jgi:hypothetical protein
MSRRCELPQASTGYSREAAQDRGVPRGVLQWLDEGTRLRDSIVAWAAHELVGKLEDARGDVMEFERAANRLITNLQARLAAYQGGNPEWRYGE